jgi:AcrR family transcriptional regulator
VPDAGPLPRGRHGLPRADVIRSQRTRMLEAAVAAISTKGYAVASVAEVIRRAGVSRETFYQQFSSKQDCFSAALDVAIERLLGTMTTAVDADGDPHERSWQLIGSYLDTLADQPALARMFLVEVYAAGPDAVRRRAESQQRVADALCAIVDDTSAQARFACEVLVTAISSMVTTKLMADDLDGLRALHAPFADLVRRALELTGEP